MLCTHQNPAEAFKQAVLRGYHDLCISYDREGASPATCQHLRGIQGMVLKAYAAGIDISPQELADLREQTSRMRPLIAKLESADELRISRELCARANLSVTTLSTLHHAGAYTSLARSELALLGSTPESQGLYHLGMGALPMSLIFMAVQRPDLRFIGVDQDERACTQAQQLVTRLGLSDRIEIIQAHGASCSFSKGYIPLIAALLTDKKAVITSAAQQGHKNFLVRDAEGIVTLIYDPFELKDSGCQEIQRTRNPNRDRINFTRHLRVS